MKSLIRLSFKLLFTVIILAGFVYFGIKYALPQLEHKGKLYAVTKIYDGDTFETEIDGKKERVRMLGIDTPEKFESDKLNRDIERTQSDKETIKRLGELSFRYVSKLLEGKMVRLESDPVNDNIIVPALYGYKRDDNNVQAGHLVPYTFQSRIARNGHGKPADIVPALTANGQGDTKPLLSLPATPGVRRFTPRECERVQGFPDDWTDKQSDPVRYRQLGNAVVPAVAEWIAGRIIEIES